MITGIIVALPEELTTLTNKKVAKGSFIFIAENILVVYSGAGSVNAAAGAKLLIANGATRLISWGCAAALAMRLNPGDLILADKLIDAENIEHVVDLDWHSHAKKTLEAYITVSSGNLADSVGIISSSKDKKQMHAKTGAVALDMESMSIAKVAKHHSLPVLVIRVIADPVSMSLPKAINYSLNSQGEIVMPKLLFFILLRPSELPGLIKLGIHFSAAKKTLKSIAKQLDKMTNFTTLE